MAATVGSEGEPARRAPLGGAPWSDDHDSAYAEPPTLQPAGDPLGAEALPDANRHVGARPDSRGRSGPRTAVTPSSGPQHLTLPWPRPGTGPLVLPEATVRHRWRKVAGRTLSKAWSDSLFGLSSQAAFWSALSTAPLLLALLGLVGFVGRWFGPGTITAVQDQVITVLHGIFSPEVVDGLLKSNVENLLHTGQADLVSVGFFISLWAGSSAISAFVEAITIAYGQHEVRNAAVERFFALGLYLVALVAGVVTLPLLAIGPEALTNLFPAGGIRDQAGAIISIAYFPGIVIALVLLLATFYKVAPKHKHPWRRGIPGAVLATAVFVVASFGLRLYVSYVYTHGLTYGALATPITFLLFYYMMALAIIMGAQFNNATLEYYPPRVSPRESRKWQRYDPTADDRVR